jgi:HlyD family secretion protein
MKRSVKRNIFILIAIGLIGVAVVLLGRRGNGESISFRTAPVSRGDLVVSISATGTVEPEEVVDVGAQVAGRILSFGEDADGKTVDYGSTVKKGTILARIDDSIYAADEAAAKAQVESAKAGLKRSQADLEQMKAKLHQAERDWARAQTLGPSEALAQASYDAYQSAYETAKANVTVAKATIVQAHSSVTEAEATLLRAERNLGYCTITSPVEGVIIDRRVNIGQTVVASLNAPSLFLIAKDLKRMQVWVAVNEADIGKIHPGQPVTFTVDAFPGETFRGEVRKVRLNASMTQNVVTYTVEITTDNSDGRLLPYLTANVQFELSRSRDVLLVPNTALRWTPAPEQIASGFREASSKGGSPTKSTEGHGPSGNSAKAEAIVWTPDHGYVRPVRVRLGPSDGSVTEVEGEGLAKGTEVVTGVRQPQEGDSGEVTNPFTPRFHGGNRQRSRQGSN